MLIPLWEIRPRDPRVCVSSVGRWSPSSLCNRPCLYTLLRFLRHIWTATPLLDHCTTRVLHLHFLWIDGWLPHDATVSETRPPSAAAWSCQVIPGFLDIIFRRLGLARSVHSPRALPHHVLRVLCSVSVWIFLEACRPFKRRSIRSTTTRLFTPPPTTRSSYAVQPPSAVFDSLFPYCW